jgi:signal transduction histidine kinase
MKEGGVLKITTRFSSLTDTVKIDIQDSGCGIPKALQCRVFDPFYSTKSFGERKGLGLYISYVLVKKSGGDIRLISTCGEGEGDTITRTGTMFTIELPADRSGK